MNVIAPGCDGEDQTDQTAPKAQKSYLMTEEKHFTLINLMQGLDVYILQETFNYLPRP